MRSLLIVVYFGVKIVLAFQPLRYISQSTQHIRNNYATTNSSEPVSSFNRFTRGLGDVFAYTTGDLVGSAIDRLGRYIPSSSTSGPVPTIDIAPLTIEPISSFGNFSEHSLVNDTLPDISTYVLPPINDTSIAVGASSMTVSTTATPRRGIVSRIKSLFWRRKDSSAEVIPQQDSQLIKKPQKEGVIRRARNAVSLLLRRRLYNLFDRSPSTWAKFKNSRDEVFISPKSIGTARRLARRLDDKLPAKRSLLANLRKGLGAVFSRGSNAKDDAEYFDYEADAGGEDDRNFRIFRQEKVSEKSLLSSVVRGIQMSGEYLSQVNELTASRSRLDGLFSDGKNLMSVSVQLLSNVSIAGINAEYIGGAGSSLLKNLISTPALLGRAYRGEGDNELLVLNTPEAIEEEPVVNAEVVEAAPVSRALAFSPLLSFVWNRATNQTGGDVNQSESKGSILNSIPIVRMLPWVSSLIFPAPASSEDSQAPPMLFQPNVDGYLTSVGTRRPAGDEEKVLPSFPLPPPMPLLPVSLTNLPQPAKADLVLLKTTRISAAVCSALSISSFSDFAEYMRTAGLKPLLAALIKPPPTRMELKYEAARALRRLIRYDPKVIPAILAKPNLIDTLNDMIEESLGYTFGMFRSTAEKDYKLKSQYEALSLVLRLVRESDQAIRMVRGNPRLLKTINQIKASGESIPDDMNTLAAKDLDRIMRKPDVEKRVSNSTVISDSEDLALYEMARIASWAIGGVEWKPAQRNQRGLRILSFDGGGTRGVLSIAILKELMQRVGINKRPFEMFDVICGTSTGGIVAVLLGINRMEMDDVEILYDNLISKIFGKGSGLKLVTDKAYYDEASWEQVLDNICKDELLVDSNKYNCPRVFCVSANVSSAPQKVQLWTNYNYPPSLPSTGSFRINTAKAVRVTSAAPAYFPAVTLDGYRYVDGAIVANNPTDLAIREAKKLYDEDIELIVSIGTGLYSSDVVSSNYEWVDILGNLVAASTDTERIHEVIQDFHGEDKYFRLNPVLNVSYGIDVKDAAALSYLKSVGKEYLSIYERDQPKQLDRMIKILRGLTYSSNA